MATNKPSAPTSLVHKVYILTENTNNSTRRFNKLKEQLLSEQPPPPPKSNNKKVLPSLEVVQVPFISAQEITDELLQSVSTPWCSRMCSPDMVRTWLTHTQLWADIAQRNEGHVLILTDTAQLVPSFTGMLKEYWKEVPNNWDIVYLGCMGSCDRSLINDTVYRVFYNRETNVAQKDGRSMVLVNEPALPLGLYGYMLSKDGAKRLANSDDFTKVDFNLDSKLADKINSSEGQRIKAYAMSPPLVTDRGSYNKRTKDHQILKPFTEEVKISPNRSINDVARTEIGYLRPFGIHITYFTLFLLVVSVLMGYFGSECTLNKYLTVVAFILLVEVGYTRTNNDKVKMVLFELTFSLLLGTYVGRLIKAQVQKQTNVL